MIDQQSVERAAERFRLPDGSFERLKRQRDRKQRNQRIRAGVLGIAVFALVAIGFVRLLGSQGTPAPATDPRTPFLGTWVSTSDADGGTQTMTVGVSAEIAVEVTVTDDVATVCGGTPSTMTGTGRIEDGARLVIPSPVYACDDGSEPETLSGPPLEEALRDWTLVLDPATDTLSDGVGGVWLRPGAVDPSPGPTASGQMWPQTSLEEVRQAQELADAGDPRYTWQVDPHLYALTTPAAVEGDPHEAEILTRFLQEELGWQEFRATNGYASDEGYLEAVGFVRCAPDRTNPLYPNDPEGRGCAPTIDELRYETVQIDLEQLDRRGPSGIWVVTRWNTDLYGSQTQQVVPPTDAEVTGLLEAFLQARIDREDVQGFMLSPVDDMPLLYTTTSGAPYERSDIERVEGPVWPTGYLTYKLRLFAEGGDTVVEQRFTVYREGNGRLGLEYFGEGTTENGEFVAEPSSILDGEVTFAAVPPWADRSLPPLGFLQTRAGAGIEILPNSLPPDDCDPSGGTPPSAEALVRAIRSDADLEATAPIPARVGGIDAVRLDVVAAPGAATCPSDSVPVVPSPYSSGWGLLEPGAMGRLYVLDLPGGSARTLAILITAPEAAFDRAVEAATPVLKSFEFHTE